MGDNPKTVSEMLGEALREIAVLVIVFAPLDRWVERRPYTWNDVSGVHSRSQRFSLPWARLLRDLERYTRNKSKT
jgi:hypothetical protein